MVSVISKSIEANKLNSKLIEELQFLLGSEKRLHILYEISTSANTPRMLKERVKIPKSSLNRCLNQLIKRTFIEAKNGEFFVTEFGKLLLGEILKFTEQVTSTYAAKELFGYSCFSGIPQSLLTEFKVLCNNLET